MRTFPIAFRKPVLMAVLVAAVWMGAAPVVGAAPITLYAIRSGTGWLTTTVDQGGNLSWTTVGYDDSAWTHATAPYPNAVTSPSSILPGSGAQLMWSCDPAVYTCTTGSSGPNQAYFRYDFTLDPGLFSSPGFAASAWVIADDFFEMYVNGQFVTSAILGNHIDPNTGQPVPLLVNFTSQLQAGPNVIAIRACDGRTDAQGAFTCTDNVNEYVFFETVPEPGTWLLLGTGLAGLVIYGRRRRQSAA